MSEDWCGSAGGNWVTADGQHICIGIKDFNAVPDNIKVEAQKTQLIHDAKKTFGTTTDFREAGYITPDGKLLDFSGRSEGATAGKERLLDHTDIGRVTPDTEQRGGMKSVNYAEQRGLMRVAVLSDYSDVLVSVDVKGEYTDKQWDKLKSAVRVGRIKEAHFGYDIYDDDKTISTNYGEGVGKESDVDELRGKFNELKVTRGKSMGKELNVRRKLVEIRGGKINKQSSFNGLIIKAVILKGLWEKAESPVVKGQVLIKFREALESIKEQGGIFKIKAGHPIIAALNDLDKETATSGAGGYWSPRYTEYEDKDKVKKDGDDWCGSAGGNWVTSDGQHICVNIKDWNKVPSGIRQQARELQAKYRKAEYVRRWKGKKAIIQHTAGRFRPEFREKIKSALSGYSHEELINTRIMPAAPEDFKKQFGQSPSPGVGGGWHEYPSNNIYLNPHDPRPKIISHEMAHAIYANKFGSSMCSSECRAMYSDTEFRDSVATSIGSPYSKTTEKEFVAEGFELMKDRPSYAAKLKQSSPGMEKYFSQIEKDTGHKLKIKG